MTDRDVLIVEEYISDNIVEPDNRDPNVIFKFHSYSSWAAHEILDRVIREASKLPPHVSGEESMSLEEVIDEFIEDMLYYKDIADATTVCAIFEIAIDEAVCMKMYAQSLKLEGEF